MYVLLTLPLPVDFSITLQISSGPGGYTSFHSSGSCASGDIASTCSSNTQGGGGDFADFGNIQLSHVGAYDLKFQCDGEDELVVEVSIAGGGLITEVAPIAGTLSGNTLSSVKVVAADRAAANS